MTATLQTSPASGTELTAAGVECILAWGHRSGLEDGTNEEKLDDALRAMDVVLALGCRVMRVRPRRPVLLRFPTTKPVVNGHQRAYVHR